MIDVSSKLSLLSQVYLKWVFAYMASLTSLRLLNCKGIDTAGFPNRLASAASCKCDNFVMQLSQLCVSETGLVLLPSL